MSYEIKIPVSTPGAEKIDDIAGAMSRVQKGTKLTSAEFSAFRVFVEESVKSGKSLTDTLQDLTARTSGASSAMKAAAGDLRSFASDTIKAEAALKRLTNAHEELVPATAAASAAIRTLEGQMSLRAVERFSTSVLGLGPILQAAFPIFGAVAFGETIYRTVERIDPLVKAQKLLAESTKRLDAEYAQLEKRFERLQIQTITDKFGKMAGANLAAFYAESDLRSDKARLADLDRQIDKIKAKIGPLDAAAGMLSRFGLGPGAVASQVLKRFSASDEADVTRLEGQRMGLSGKINADTAQKDKDLADASKAAAREAKAAAKEAAAEAARIAKEFASIVKQLSGAGESPLQRLSDRYDTGKSLYSGDAGKRSELDSAYSAGYNREIADHLAKEREKITTAQERALEQARVEGPILAGRIESGEYSDYKKSLRVGGDDSALGNMFRSLPKRIGATSADRLRLADDEERQGVRQIQAGGQKNDELETAGKVAAFQISASEKRLALQLQIANSETDATKKQEDSQNAELDYQRHLFDIRSGYEDKIIEKRKQNQQESVSAISGLILSANGGSNGITNYLKGFAQNLESKVLDNGLKQIIQPGQFSLTKDPNSPIGKLLSGTMFGSVPADPTAKRLDTTNSWLQAIYGAVSGNTGITDPSSAATTTTTPSFPGFGSGTVAGSSAIGGGLDVGSLLGLASGGTASSATLAAIGKNIASPSFSGIAGALGGTKFSGDLQGIFTGIHTNADGTGETLSTSEQIGGAAGTAGIIYGGVQGVASGIKQGGAKGTTQAIGSAAATAAALDPEPISKAALEIAALTAQVVGSFLGDPRADRAHEQEKELGNAKYNAPLAISQTVDGSGNYTDSDRFGNLRTSPFRGSPSISEPGQYYRNGVYEQVPGYQTSPYQTGPSITINMQAMDAKNIMDRSADIGAAVAAHVTSNPDSALVRAVNYAQGA